METLAPKNAGSTIGNSHGQYSYILIWNQFYSLPKPFQASIFPTIHNMKKELVFSLSALVMMFSLLLVPTGRMRTTTR